MDQGIISLTPRPSNEKINGATIDVRLGNSFRVFREHTAPFIDLSGPKERPTAQLDAVMSGRELLLERMKLSFYIRVNWLWPQH